MDLSKDALQQLDRINGGAAELEQKMEVIDTSKQVPIHMGGKENALPPRTPNYGKTPKYLTKYKEEAKEMAAQKEEQRLAKLRPPGTRQLPEPERVATLE